MFKKKERSQETFKICRCIRNLPKATQEVTHLGIGESHVAQLSSGYVVSSQNEAPMLA